MPPRVYVDAGHDRFDPGAGSGGRHEHPEALEVLRPLDRRLAELGITRSIDLSGNDPGWAGSVKRANASGAELALEVHFDWHGGVDAAFGIYVSPDGKRFAEHLTAALADVGFPLWRGGAVHEDSIGRSGLGFLNKTTMPAVILELGRVGDYPPAVNVRQGIAVAEGIAAALGVVVDVPVEPEPDEPEPMPGDVFRDVPATHPHAASIEWAHERGLLLGEADGDFEPGEPLTRGQAATLARRIVAYLRELDRQDHDAG